MMKYGYCLALISLLCMAGCQPQPQDQAAAVVDQQQLVSKAVQEQFQTWHSQQEANGVDDYPRYVALRVKQPLSLFSLSYNGHRMPKQCEPLRFSVPPKALWPNIIPSLKLVERFQSQGIYAHYRIISTFRSDEMNTCIHGAKLSKHMQNHAVDFKVLNAQQKPYSDAAYQQIEQQLCAFWHKSGKALNMGLGIYPGHSLHIDVAGYRTWGGDYRRQSSPCIRTEISAPK